MLLVVAASWIMKPNAHIAYMRWRRRRRRSRGRWSHCDCLTAIMNMQWWFDMPCRCRHLCTCREIGVIVGGGGGAPLQKENEASFWRVFAAFVYSPFTFTSSYLWDRSRWFKRRHVCLTGLSVFVLLTDCDWKRDLSWNACPEPWELGAVHFASCCFCKLSRSE